MRRIRTRERHVAVSVASLALFGLFAMHGWGVHGSGHEAFTSQASEACDAPVTHHCPPDPAEPSGDHGLIGLCLAVLGGAAAVALALVAQRRQRFFWPAGRLRHVLVPRWIRERDPPDLLALGVIRC